VIDEGKKGGLPDRHKSRYAALPRKKTYGATWGRGVLMEGGGKRLLLYGEPGVDVLPAMQRMGKRGKGLGPVLRRGKEKKKLQNLSEIQKKKKRSAMQSFAEKGGGETQGAFSRRLLQEIWGRGVC